MAIYFKSPPFSILVVALLLQVLAIFPVIRSIGINYGLAGSNLPPPTVVADFLWRHTAFDRVRVYDCDPIILSAFAAVPLPLVVTLSNSLIPSLTSLPSAKLWLQNHLLPSANISLILLGNELLSTGNRTLVSSLVPALQTLHTALVSLSLHTRVRLSTPLSLSILSHSFPPSAARFHEGYDNAVIRPLLAFLRATGSPFTVNAYPYFGSSSDNLDFALFRAGAGVVDNGNGLLYTNMFDAQLDAVYSAMRQLGFGDVDIAVSETGWPSRGDTWQSDANMTNAGEYVRRLVEHVNSGVGTPLMPNRTFETYIFSMFDEDMKRGPESERDFGVFDVDLKPKYDAAGLMRVVETPTVRRWCVPRGGAEVEVLQANLDYACGQGMVDCTAIREGGPCFFPNTVESHAAFAMNQLYRAGGTCDFGGSGVVTMTDPSYGDCKYRS